MKLSISKNYILIFVAATTMAFTQFSCNRADRTEAGNETTAASDQAYEDFKSYVSTLETDIERGWDSTATDADARMNQWRTDYEAKSAAVARYENDFDEDRKREYAELQSRYNTAWATREEQYNTWRANNQSAGMTNTADSDRMYTVGTDLLGMDMRAKSVDDVTSKEIVRMYENFVAKVEANKSTYSNQDWEYIEGYWNSLDNRKNAIQNELTDKDKWEIAKAKTKYIAMKNANKAGNTASKIGSNAKEVGKDVSNSKVGEAAKDAGKAVGNTAKKAGQKVGDALDGKDNE